MPCIKWTILRVLMPARRELAFPWVRDFSPRIEHAPTIGRYPAVSFLFSDRFRISGQEVVMPCLIALMVLTLLAAPTVRPVHREGFASAGMMVAGDDPSKRSLAIGGEKIDPSGIAGGGDVLVMAGLTRPRPKYPNGQSYRQYVLSGVIGGHWQRARGVAPFLNGGLSYVTDPDCCGPLIGWNLGGGANYWFSSHFGVRTDARLVLAFKGEGGLAIVRIGVAFR